MPAAAQIAGQDALGQLAVQAEPVFPAAPENPPESPVEAAQLPQQALPGQFATPAEQSPAAFPAVPENRPEPPAAAQLPTLPPSRMAGSALPTQPLPPRPAVRRFELTTLNIVLGLAVIVLLIANLLQLNQARLMRDDQNDLIRTIQANQVINALASEPAIDVLAINGPRGQGTLLFEKNGNSAILFLRNLPLLDSDHTYQAWLVPASGPPVSAGIFHTNAGTPFASFLINASQSFKSYTAISVTLEPAGGSSAPTTTPLVSVKL
jgi:hypothetical protein